ncbi:MAG: tRNA 2-thiouridine(34) synthase MnmA, partial [Anaerolineales bacterium]
YDQVVQTFINDYLEGKTPNPCLFCNPHIKWGILQSYAFNQGADFFASGHYARIEYLGSGQVHLLRGKDPNKDQSYVLSMLTQSQLGRSLFPIGDMLKGEVRSLAHRLGLTFIDREESQDLCFLGNVDYRDFLIRYAPQAANLGEIVNERGEVLGEHNGLAFYTIGQRKGIRIAASQPYFVIGKDREKNHLVVGFVEQTERSNLIAIKPNWIAGKPPDEGKNYSVMIRYRAKPVNAALFYISSDEFRLEFNDGVRGITPGQAAVLYQGEVCLGGGIIHASR